MCPLLAGCGDIGLDSATGDTGSIASQTTRLEQSSGSINWVQIGNPSYVPAIHDRSLGRGRTIAIDAAHHNFHHCEGDFSTVPLAPTQSNVGRYWAFCELLHQNGFAASDSTSEITRASLEGVDAYVIAHAAAAPYVVAAEDHSQIAINPAAAGETLSASERAALLERVSQGRMGLLVVVDHAPFLTNQRELFTDLGIFTATRQPKDFSQIIDPLKATASGFVFTGQNGGIASENPILRGLSWVETGIGCALPLPPGGVGLLRHSLSAEAVYMTYEAWVALSHSRYLAAAAGTSFGWAGNLFQTIALKYKARPTDPGGWVVVSCDGSTFTSQLQQAANGTLTPMGGLTWPPPSTTEAFTLRLVDVLSSVYQGNATAQ